MDRRKFLIKSGLATAALATGPVILANSLPKKQINIGVIGTGNRGCGMIPVINSIKNLNVAACCDILPFRLKEGLKRAKGTAKGYKNYKDVLKDKNIDAILIATTFSEHAKVAIDAVKAGKHIYCEKTLAKGYQGIKNLVNTVKDSSIIFQTGHQFHSSRLYTHVVDLIKNGKVGKIATVEAQWNRKNNWRRPVPEPSLEKAINWRMYREYSGGLTAELSSHQIDFVNTILEANPIQVMGAGGVDYWKDGRETFDNTHLLFTYPKGVKAKFTCLTTNKKDSYQIKVLGSEGSLIITTNTAKFYPNDNKTKKPKAPKDVDGVSGATWQIDDLGYYEPINIVHTDPSKQALIDFRDSIHYKKEPESNIISGAKAAICVQMALDAMYNNKIVQWKENIL